MATAIPEWSAAPGSQERLRGSDEDRRGYIREHFGRDWLDPTLYHLCLDTGRLGIDTAVELIRFALETRTPAA